MMSQEFLQPIIFSQTHMYVLLYVYILRLLESSSTTRPWKCYSTTNEDMLSEVPWLLEFFNVPNSLSL